MNRITLSVVYALKFFVNCTSTINDPNTSTSVHLKRRNTNITISWSDTDYWAHMVNTNFLLFVCNIVCTNFYCSDEGVWAQISVSLQSCSKVSRRRKIKRMSILSALSTPVLRCRCICVHQSREKWKDVISTNDSRVQVINKKILNLLRYILL